MLISYDIIHHNYYLVNDRIIFESIHSHDSIVASTHYFTGILTNDCQKAAVRIDGALRKK